MDTCKIERASINTPRSMTAPEFACWALYKRRSADNSLLFLEKVIEKFPFPIQRIQPDRGSEFFAYIFQETLMEYGIKFVR
jgi:hypothetical protein